MKEWIKADITELDLNCTEHGGTLNTYVDEIKTDVDGPWYAFSGNTAD